MTLSDLIDEYIAAREDGGLVLDRDRVLACAIDATRFYAGYGDIQSLAVPDVVEAQASTVGTSLYPASVLSALLMGGVSPSNLGAWVLGGASERDFGPEPIKSPADILAECLSLTTGEWAVIRPLFLLYIEREQAVQLEATRGSGIDPFGRSVSEVAGDIRELESENGIPARAFVTTIITI